MFIDCRHLTPLRKKLKFVYNGFHSVITAVSKVNVKPGTDYEFQCSWGLRRRWRSYWLDHPRRTCLVRSQTNECPTTRGL